MRVLLWLVFLGSLVSAQTGQKSAGIGSGQPSSNEQVCKDPTTQAEISQCAIAEYQRADKELNQPYSELKKTQDAAVFAKLQAAQRAWVGYRDANCDAEAALYEGGSIVPTIRADCLESLTRERIKELHRIYETESR
jgi:uncharacterized protein YecT (DUF1311 family)